MKQNQVQQKEIRLGTHGEHYGSWMSNPVFYVIGALLALSVVLAVLSFAVFHIAALGVLFSVAAAALLALLVWITWIRKQYVCLVKSRFQKRARLSFGFRRASFSVFGAGTPLAS